MTASSGFADEVYGVHSGSELRCLDHGPDVSRPAVSPGAATLGEITGLPQ